MAESAAVMEASEAQGSALSRVIALINDKGGVGKTSLTSNTGGQLAAAGYKVLLIDLNRQANLSDDLGYRGKAGVDDQGHGLLTAIVTGQPLHPVRDVRPNLDVVPGGVKLESLTPVIQTNANGAQERAAFLALADAMQPIAEDYDVILIDSPPENVTLGDLALGAARWVIMPTKSDAGGLVGMQLVAQRFARAREINPLVGLLGVVLFASGSNAKAIHKSVREHVAEAFGGQQPMLATTIRHSERVAYDARSNGLLAHELEVAAAAQPAWWAALRGGEKQGPRISNTAASVSADYRQLAIEILEVLNKAEEAELHEESETL